MSRPVQFFEPSGRLFPRRSATGRTAAVFSTFAYRIRTTTAVTLSTTATVFVRFLGQRGDAVAAVLFQYTLTRGQTVETGQAIRSTTSVLLLVVVREEIINQINQCKQIIKCGSLILAQRRCPLFLLSDALRLTLGNRSRTHYR